MTGRGVVTAIGVVWVGVVGVAVVWVGKGVNVAAPGVPACSPTWQLLLQRPLVPPTVFPPPLPDDPEPPPFEPLPRPGAAPEDEPCEPLEVDPDELPLPWPRSPPLPFEPGDGAGVPVRPSVPPC